MAYTDYKLTLNHGEIKTVLKIQDDFDIYDLNAGYIWGNYATEWEYYQNDLGGGNTRADNQNYLGEIELYGKNLTLFSLQITDIPTTFMVIDGYSKKPIFKKILSTIEKNFSVSPYDGDISTIEAFNRIINLGDFFDWHWEFHRKSELTIGVVLKSKKIMDDFFKYLDARKQIDGRFADRYKR